jgi:hypothetical protein
MLEPGRHSRIGRPCGIEWGGKHASGSTAGQELPLEGAKSLGEGSSSSPAAASSSRAESPRREVREGGAGLRYANGLRLERTIGNALIRYRCTHRGRREIVAELVSRFMR